MTKEINFTHRVFFRGFWEFAIALLSMMVVTIKNRRYLAMLIAAGLLPTVFVGPAAAQQASVLVDASRDGGVWWFPQAGPFDPNLPHQGKALADFLRTQGMTVTELPRPSTITSQQLSQYDLVMVAGSCGTYSAAEFSAYNDYLSNGGRLILLGEHRCNFDNLPQSLGLDFDGSFSGVITEFTPHPITTGVTALPFGVGGMVAMAPASANMLGFLSGMPVMGVMPFGPGRVFFLGDTNGIEGIPQPFVNNLFKFMLTGNVGRGIGGRPQADLAVLDATFSADPKNAGHRILFWEFFPTALITNLGPEAAQNISVKFDLIRWPVDGRAAVSPLDPGESTWVVPPRDQAGRGIEVQPGNYTLRVTVHSTSSRTDPDQSNNQFELPVILPDQ